MRPLAPVLLLALGCHRESPRDASAAVGLRTLLTAQQDFHANDRDGDGRKAYWVKDVAGLHGFRSMKLVDLSVAQADRTLDKGAYPAVADEEPYVGAYWFAALPAYRENGRRVPYDDGSGRHPSRYGIAGFPVAYGRTGTLTFLIDQSGVVYAKDTRGRAPDEFPENLAAGGWRPYSR